MVDRAPGFVFALAAVAGIATVRWTAHDEGELLAGGIALALTIGLLARALAILRRGAPRWAETPAGRATTRVVVFGLLGMTRASTELLETPPRDLDGEVVRLHGVIVTPPLTRARVLAGRVRVETDFDLAVNDDDGRTTLQVVVSGRLQRFAAGESVVVVGRVRMTRPHRNPGSPARAPRAILDVSHPRQLSTATRKGALLDSVLGTLRGCIASTLSTLYDERPRGVLLALLLGDRRLLPADARSSFERTGTFHLLALSGLHVGILFAAVRRIPLPRRVRLPARLLFLLGFALLTGGSPPVVRAGLMLSVHLLLQAAHRTATPLNSLGWAAIALLSWDPALIDDLGFHLSFAGVAAILLAERRRLPATDDELQDVELRLLARPRHGASPVGRLARGTFASLRTSLAAWCGTSPLVLLHFQRIHLFSPLWNVAASPLIFVLVAGGAASVALALVWAPLGIPCAWATSWSGELLIALLSALGETPGSLIPWPPPSGRSVVLAEVALLSLGLRWRRTAAVVAAATLASVLADGTGRVPERIELWTLDVGSADAACLRVRGAGAYLIDAGGPGSDVTAGDGIARALLAIGETRLVAAVLTHAHDDHVRGMARIARSMSVGGVWTSPYFTERSGGAALARTLRELGLPLEPLWRGAALDTGTARNVEVRVLGPEPRETLPLRSKSNETSLALRVSCEDDALLLLGDLEEAGLARLLGTRSSLEADVLVFPHHGRSNALWRDLLRRVRPRAVLISGSGQGGAREMARRIEALGVDVLSTWRGGAIRTVWREGEGWTARYWDPAEAVRRGEER